MKIVMSVCLALLASAVPAVANVTIFSPGANATVVSPFWLSAAATPCSSQPVAAMGYSYDDSPNTTIVNAASISATINSATGTHSLHIKSWGNQGASCVTSITLNVVPAPTSTLPRSTVKIGGIQTLGNWKGDDDLATGSGTASGVMNVVGAPSLSGYARNFSMNYTSGAGERFYVPFGVDAYAQNFLYDVWVNIANPSGGIANLELDMNQVMANGQTVIYGVQCDGYSGTWDYTANTGTPWKPNDVWIHSKAECNPREWSTNSWHHIQMSYSRDNRGNVTYKSIWLDNIEQDLYVTVPSSFALGWASSTLLTNFQIDGLGSNGSATIYTDNMTIYRW
jgi:hypothetical protein